MLNYLTKEEIIAINQEVVKISVDPHGVMNEANLTHLVEGMCLKYENSEDALILKAAFILDYLANKGHIFIEGNKRTAETTTFIFLRLNGLFFEEKDQKELVNFVLQVAQGKESLTSIAKWLKERVKKTS